MPNIVLTSFNGGEITPNLDARSDIEKYASSCRIMENMLPSVHGGATRRPGTEYIATVRGGDSKARLIPFIYSASIAYVCEFTEGWIRFYYDGALLTDDADDTVEIESPYLAAELPSIQYRQVGDVMWLVHANHAPRKLSRTAVTTFELATIQFEDGPFLERNDRLNDDDVEMTCSVTAVDDTGTLTASANTFTSLHVGSLWSVIHSRDTTQVNFIKANVAGSAYSSAADGYSDALDVSGGFDFTTSGIWFGTVSLYRSEDQGDNWDLFRAWTSDNNANVSYSGTEEQENIQYRIGIEITAASTGKARCHLSCQMALTYGVVRIDEVLSATVAEITVMTEVESTDATTRWAEGSWSKQRGYPSAVAFFEDRIIYGGTAHQQSTVWFSETDDYEDFKAGVNDADSFELSILSTNRIRWLEGLNAIIVGTAGDEWRIASNKLEQPITPTNFSAKRQTTHGSVRIQPVRVDSAVLFVDYVQRKVREFVFAADQQTYVAPDLTMLAEHITIPRITAIAFQRNPEPILWCVRGDGVLLSMTYLRDQNVIAWARHMTPRWTTEDAADTEDDGTSIDWGYGYAGDGRISNPRAESEPEEEEEEDACDGCTGALPTSMILVLSGWSYCEGCQPAGDGTSWRWEQPLDTPATPGDPNGAYVLTPFVAGSCVYWGTKAISLGSLRLHSDAACATPTGYRAIVKCQVRLGFDTNPPTLKMYFSDATGAVEFAYVINTTLPVRACDSLLVAVPQSCPSYDNEQSPYGGSGGSISIS